MGGAQGVEGIRGIGLVAVEEVLGIVEHRLAGGLAEEGDRVRDEREVLLQGDAQGVAHVEIPGLAEDGDDIGASGDQLAQVVVIRRRGLRPARRTEGGDAGVGQLQLLDLGEVGLVLGVGARPAAFDVGDSEPVEGFGEGELVRQAEVDALALRAVTQGGVVDLQGACPAIGSGGGGRGAHGVSVSVRVLGGAFT